MGIDLAKEVEVRVFNFSKNGAHELIGTAILEYDGIENDRVYKIRSKNQNKGNIHIEHFYDRTQYEFGDFIQAGLQLSLVTCIDFTASNGIYTHKDSLHYSSPGKKSQYE